MFTESARFESAVASRYLGGEGRGLVGRQGEDYEGARVPFLAAVHESAVTKHACLTNRRAVDEPILGIGENISYVASKIRS